MTGKYRRAAAKAPAGLVKTLRFWQRTWLVPSFRSLKNQITTNLNSFVSERQFIIWAVALGVGGAIAYAAIGFRLLIGLFQVPWLFTTSERIVSAAYLVPWWADCCGPDCGRRDHWLRA